MNISRILVKDESLDSKIRMTTKIDQAVKLCENRNKDISSFQKGVGILEKIVINRLQTKESRFDALRKLFSYDRAAANDILARIRDGIPFLLESEQSTDDEVFVLYNASLGAFVESHDRIVTAVCLYNNSFIQECMTLFQYLAQDGSLLLDYRVEACMYLVYTEDDRFRSIAVDVLTEIVGDTDLANQYRYEKVICKFNSKVGLCTILNNTELNVQYDEDLLHILQRTYFDNTSNDIRYRILSGQHLLQMEIVKDGERNTIGEKILEIARSFESPRIENALVFSPEDVTNIRADAADVISRLGTDDQQKEANEVIHSLGFFGSSEGGKRHNLLTHRGLISYVGDAQNIHNSSIRKAIHKFISTIVEENKEEKLSTYSEVHTELTSMIHTSNLNPTQIMKAFKSLGRINIDTAVFTDKKLTSADVMIHLWAKLQRIFKEEEESKCNEILQRLLDELVDMADTCSSGHAGRLANVLAGFGYDVEITVSFKEQIVANTSARMNKRIMDIPDEELKQRVICGMTPDDGDQEDIDAFVKFISDNTPSLRQELYDEFVKEGWVEESKFNLWFDESVNSWTQKENRFIQDEE